MKRLGVRHLRTGLSWADSFRPNALDWFDRQMEALADFDVMVTFCFTPEHLGVQPHHTSPPRNPSSSRTSAPRWWNATRPRSPCAPQQGDDAMPDGSLTRTASTSPSSGVGNCASSLVQGIALYREDTGNEHTGLMHWDLGGYRPGDIHVVAAWDIDRRKVGQGRGPRHLRASQLHCHLLPGRARDGRQGRMGRILDGFAPHMADQPEHRTFVKSDEPEPDKEDVVRVLRESGTHV
jgi:hypothetical protein